MIPTVVRPHATKFEKNRERISTGGEVFGDGCLIEMVHDPSDPTRPALLFWKGKRPIVVREVRTHGRCYVPLEVDRRILRQLRLPGRPVPYGSTTELFDAIHELVAISSSLTSDHAALLACFALSSWFPECLTTSPCLLLRGSSSADATALLRILAWVCRHSLLLADAGAAVSAELRPTRLICQADRHVDKLLAAFRARGFATSRNGSFNDMAGATAIYLAERELESILADTCLSIPVNPGGRLLSARDEQRLSSAVDELQAKLLCYRITNFEKVRASEFDVPEFVGPMREVARNLGACVIDAPDVQKQLVDQLRAIDAAIQVEGVSRLTSIVVEALLACCHEGWEAVHVGQITELVNGILSRQSETLTLNAREVGARLKCLGFRTIRLDSAGRGMYLLTPECKRVHELALSFRLPSLAEGLPGCPQCRAAGETRS